MFHDLLNYEFVACAFAD